jgi:CRISPR-associated endoribonuclease Cas6
MPSRWQITAPGTEACTIRMEHLHAVVSRWLEPDDAAHRAKTKPYTLSRPTGGADGAVFEVGLLDDALVNRILTAASPGIRVRLGSRFSRLGPGPRQLAAISWQQLAHPRTTTTWCLRFATPTTFRRGNSFTPWVAPKPLLGGLRATWRAFCPADVPPIELNLSSDPVWVSDVDGANQILTLGGLTVSGFVGRARYVCDAGPGVAATVDRVMRLAEFAGVGAYTTRGLGKVELEPSWRQRR